MRALPRSHSASPVLPAATVTRDLPCEECSSRDAVPNVERLRESKRLNIARTGTEAALFQVLVEPRQHALLQVDPM